MAWLIVIIIPTALYGFLILRFYFGWRKLVPFEISQNQLSQFVTVVIAARNEAVNLPFLLHDLAYQTYPNNRFEVIVVDDHSTDNSLKILSEAKLQISNLQFITLMDEHQGKKLALRQGINATKSELIITTDADCRVGEKWIETLVSYYLLNKPDLIIGPIAYNNEKSVFEFSQSLEVLSLVASGAGAASIGIPILCNGANLLFTRELYNGSYQKVKTEIPSGDDIFLLLAAKKLKNSKIHFIKSIDALVITQPIQTISEFVSQRKRWTSKSSYYKDISIIFTAIIVLSMAILQCSLFITSIIWPKLFFVYFAILLLKSVIDWPLLFSFSGFFKKRYLLKYFAITQIIYPFYIVSMAVYGNISKFEWKNRLYK